MSRGAGLVAIVGLALALGACTSNPTPHPHDDARQTTTDHDAGVPTTGVDEPDRDDNGVGDCTELGGHWHDGACHGASLDPDAAADVVGGDADTSDADDADDAYGEVRDGDGDDDVYDPDEGLDATR